MKRNYTHSAYMLPNESGLAQEFLENVDYARFLHYVDMVRFRVAELEAAGLMTVGMSVTVHSALQMSQYTCVYIKLDYFIREMDAMLETLPTHVAAPAAKPSRVAAFFAALA